MSRTLGLVGLVGVALALVAGPAAAGPIRWAYRAETSDGAGGTWAYFGTDYKDWYDPATGQEGRTAHLVLGEIGAAVNGEAAGPGAVRVLTMGRGQLRGYEVGGPDASPGSRPSSWEETRPTFFALEVTVTDAASGESRTLEYAARGTGLLFAATGTGVVSLWAEDRTDEFVLGGNRYTVRPVAGGSESAAHLGFAVTAAPAPEPATLGLAGIGLLGVWVRRRLRADGAGAGA